MKSGIVIVNKEKGWTSQDVVSKVKRILQVKKAGHIGTLDPLATGVLPVLIGDATKLSKYLVEHNKTYIATIGLGQKKDTGDDEGEVIQTSEVGVLEEKTVAEVLKSFEGKQMQIPPKYSAIKINGKKLYEYARAGEEIEIPARNIEIYAMQLLQINQDEKKISFEVSCSKGTYIRVLCEDIAEKMGTCGYMKNLQRTAVNQFLLKDAVTVENLTEKQIISVEKICEKYPKIDLNERKLQLFLNGVILTMHREDGIYRIYQSQNFVGLGVVKNELLKRDVVVN